MEKNAEELPRVTRADFIGEARDLASLPAPGAPEVVVAGRSNVGKSTLVNLLAGRRALARTSKSPGRTRGIIFYDLAVRFADGGGGHEERAFRLVDVPGFGYARVSQKERLGWGPLMEKYVESRPALKLFLVLADARRGVENDERQLLDWLHDLSVPAQIVLTKFDKLPASERGLAAQRARSASGQPDIPVVATSGQTGEGIGKLWRVLRRIE